MSGSVNKVILIGNLGADPEVRTFPSGGKVCSLRVATSENWKDRNTGERRERTEWHTVQILNEGLIRVAEQYLRKGSKVYLEGMLKTRKWKDQSGSDRFATEVVLQGFDSTMTMLDPGDGAGATGASRSGGSNGYGQSGGYGSGQREGSSGYGQQGGGDTGGYGGGNHGPYGNQAPDRDALNRKLDEEIPF